MDYIESFNVLRRNGIRLPNIFNVHVCKLDYYTSTAIVHRTSLLGTLLYDGKKNE